VDFQACNTLKDEVLYLTSSGARSEIREERRKKKERGGERRGKNRTL